MSALAGVFDDLNTMGLLQLLLAFVACMAYLLAQGRLLPRTGRAGAGALAVGSASAFIVMDRDWMNAVVLTAIAIAGLGSFTAMVWLTTRAIGFDRGAAHEVVATSTAVVAEAMTEPAGNQGRPIRGSTASA
jgi:hypothetical protein